MKRHIMSKHRRGVRSRGDAVAESLESRTLLSSYYVSASAAAGGTGTSGSPFNTIQKALNTAVAGDTVLVRDGTYRENLLIQAGHFGTAGNLLTIEADTGAHPVITGSDAVTGWVNYSGNIWMKTGWTTNSQQVFVDGTPLQQIGRPPNPPYSPTDNPDEYPHPVGSSLADMAPGRFFYDPTGTTLYVELSDNSNPNSHAMEASTRPRLLFDDPARGYIKIVGLTFEHSNSSAIRQQDAMVTLGSNSIADNDIFEYGDFAGLTLGLNTTGVQVTNSQFLNNGDLGISGPGSQNFLIEDNLISGNNYRNFNQDWNAGGIKITSSGAHGIIENNEVANNNGTGIWFDSVTGSGSQIIDNYVHDNGPLEGGIMFELSNHALIANNVLVNNNRRGIFVTGSTDTKVYNNTISGQQGLSGIEVVAENGVNPTSDIVKNNIIANGTSTRDLDLTSGTGNASDYNDIYRSTGAIFVENGASKTFAQMQTLGFETHSTTANPNFASTSGSNYSLNFSSPAKDTGTSLSPDVTTDFLGVARPQGSAYDMGAFEYASTLSTGLEGYWHLDEDTGTTTADSSGNGNTGTLANGVAWTAPGQAGTSDLTFDGVDDKVNVANSASLSVTTAMSIGGWFNHSATGGTATAGVQKLGAYRLTAQEVNASASHWQFFVTDTSGVTHQVTTTSTYTNGAWHYIMATFNGSQMQIYVDGVAAATAVSFTGTIATTTQVFQLGQRDSAAFYKGSMDEIRLYNRALTAAEISTLYGSGGTALVVHATPRTNNPMPANLFSQQTVQPTSSSDLEKKLLASL